MLNFLTVSIKVHKLVLLEANYHYELLSRDDNIRHAQCMLLFKGKTDEKTVLLMKSVLVPTNLDCEDSNNPRLQYDAEQLDRRISLICETNPELIPYGIMVLNEDLFDYANVIKKLHRDYHIQVLLYYQPQSDMNKRLNLKVYSIIEKNKKLCFERADYQLENTEIQIDDGTSSIRQDSSEEGGRIGEETRFVQRLIEEINRMINYLEGPDNANPEVIRHISLLVSQLRKGATEDIEGETMDKECEINALNIMSEQWEMSSL
ncbi:hypothetical protein HG535_0G03420 [Zygotorulaspora mrakii]|uniref:Uncharacterized protein n=1 Tax=Zygotorulaspora mrakii TaxID=42260 RepID=A0A7H9B8Y5_ZYGMR|nr:uncharacterized protein HG535_0G03420 [Zygotorulaspora mrakii]QLG74459.1 hypothetical protein HG535_0G03420 [Zygotorulaspora mrakii]